MREGIGIEEVYSNQIKSVIIIKTIERWRDCELLTILHTNGINVIFIKVISTVSFSMIVP